MTVYLAAWGKANPTLTKKKKSYFRCYEGFNFLTDWYLWNKTSLFSVVWAQGF